MKPEEFAGVADKLRTMGGRNPQPYHRTALSRYYYSAFLEAREQLRERARIAFKPHGSHELVIRAFDFSGNKRAKVIARLLRDLKKYRESADYDLTLELSEDRVAEAETLSRKVRAEVLSKDFDYSTCYAERHERLP